MTEYKLLNYIMSQGKTRADRSFFVRLEYKLMFGFVMQLQMLLVL